MKIKKFNIKKADEEKKQVFGWANVSAEPDGTEIVDRQNDMIELEELEKSAYNYVLNFGDSGEEHNKELRQKGKLIESIVFTQEKRKAMEIPENTIPYGGWVGFQINDDDTWEKIKTGKYNMFSIQGTAESIPVSNLTAKSFNEIYKSI